MFQDADYIRKTRALIASERTRIYHLLKDHPTFDAYEPDANFLLLRIRREGLTADELFTRALQQGMMIRDCSDFPFLNDSYLRFCFMLPEQNDRLLACLLV